MDDEIIEISDSEREDTSSTSDMDVEITGVEVGPGAQVVPPSQSPQPDVDIKMGNTSAEEIVPKDAATWVLGQVVLQLVLSSWSDD